MKTIIIIDSEIFYPVVRYYIAEQQDVLIITSKDIPPDSLHASPSIATQLCNDLTAQNLFRNIEFNTETRVILCFSQNKMLAASHDALRAVNKDVPAILIGLNRHEYNEIDTPYNTSLFSVSHLVQQQLESMWSSLNNRSRLEQLRAVNHNCDNILILIQHDPDPDALASGLALRVLLGRNKQTAPIATFGSVTRSENQNMSRLLDIPVMQISTEDLKKYSKIALVDVQPPYFKNQHIQADIVFDHHPISEPYSAEFTDIRISCGSTSTILGKYLIDGGYKISQRLATALTYGIKSDTMSLERDISESDIEVFTSIYPLANLNMLRQIEHAMLAYHERGAFVKALKNMVVVDKMLFVWLGTVANEDIIPRIADFCLQIVGSEWAFVTGIYDNQISCSVRNVGYVKHAGELVQNVFGTLGSAGGHRSMAKAVIPLQVMKKHYGVRRMSDLAAMIMESIVNSIEK